MSVTVSLQTERVKLRAFEPGDIPALQAYLNHPSLTGRRYLPWRFPDTMPLSKQVVEKVCEKWAKTEKRAHLAIVLREEQELIGHASCLWGWDPHCPDVYVVISRQHQRKGYGSQVLDLLLGYFFENTQAHNIGSGMADWNQAARNFARKHGLAECGAMRRVGLRQGNFFDWIEVDILRPEWQQGSSKLGRF